MSSSSYKRLALKQFPQTKERETSEARYWRKFRHPIVQEQVAPVTHVDFSPVAPHDFAVSTSTRVHIFNAKSCKIKKTLSRFSDIVYSANFRNDGKLIVCGSEQPLVRVVDVNSRTVLRLLRGHTGPIRVAKWGSATSILSGSDDKTVRLWDLPSGKATSIFTAHEDYIRAACPSTANPNVWCTGSYDHTVKLWDTRLENKSPVMTMNHGAPVEACLIMPGGGLLLTAGGNTVNVWDILGTGNLVHTFSAHQKTITSLSLDGTGSRILTGSLDGHIKIYDIRTYEVTHGMKSNAPVLSVGVSPSNTLLVTGTADKMLTIRQRMVKAAEIQEQKSQETLLRGGTYRFFLRGKNADPGQEDFQVEVQRKVRLRPYDQALRKFRYQEALDAALETHQPVVIASLLEELIFRNGLKIALSGRDETSLEPLIAFLLKYITHPRYSGLLITVFTMVLDLYATVLGQSVVIDELCFKIQGRLKQEIGFQKQLQGLLGTLDVIMATGSRSHVAVTEDDETKGEMSQLAETESST